MRPEIVATVDKSIMAQAHPKRIVQPPRSDECSSLSIETS